MDAHNWEFQFTRPTRGATRRWRDDIANGVVSIHAPHEGRDVTLRYRGRIAAMFQFTRPTRGATGLELRQLHQRLVSIHAPHEGRDQLDLVHPARAVVSIHAPHEGRDVGNTEGLVLDEVFQFTRPTRGATRHSGLGGARRQGFNSRAPRGARLGTIGWAFSCALVSIHAPHEGRDSLRRLCHP